MRGQKGMCTLVISHILKSKSKFPKRDINQKHYENMVTNRLKKYQVFPNAATKHMKKLAFKSP
jgi:hypothetical protein